MFDVPVVVFCYRRYDKTKNLLNIIKKIGPKKIYIIHDGPKQHNDLENKKVLDLIKKFEFFNKEILSSEYNLGLKKRLVSGLDHVFKKEDKAIILEDDCLPETSFFYFCEKILDLYEFNDGIAGVTGNNFQKKRFNKDSYYFSKYSHIWGWATWKRVWKDFDLGIRFWHNYKTSKAWTKIHPNSFEREYWTKIYDKIFVNKIDSWAYSNQLCNWYFKRLTITPNKNLVKNIGFDNFSTNTKNSQKELMKEINTLDINQILLQKIVISELADNYVFKKIYLSRTEQIKFVFNNLKNKIFNKL
tara:strand:+ start:635 stop:1537 length:903 start_codon:yes stop_codon:yes gene_type:complete